MSQSIRVNIFDQIYNLRSPSGSEHVKQIAKLVDERMRQIALHATSFDLSRIAILAALNIADELEGLKAQQEKSEQENQEALLTSSSSSGKADEKPSWFEAIFDADMPVKDRSERLSSQISSRLQSLRQEDSAALTIEVEDDN